MRRTRLGGRTRPDTIIQNAAQIEDRYSYQGYALTSGRFRTSRRRGELLQAIHENLAVYPSLFFITIQYKGRTGSKAKLIKITNIVWQVIFGSAQSQRKPSELISFKFHWVENFVIAKSTMKITNISTLRGYQYLYNRILYSYCNILSCRFCHLSTQKPAVFWNCK